MSQQQNIDVTYDGKWLLSFETSGRAGKQNVRLICKS